MVWIIEADNDETRVDAATDYDVAEAVAYQWIADGCEEVNIYDDESVFTKPVKTIHSWDIHPEPDDGP